MYSLSLSASTALNTYEQRAEASHDSEEFASSGSLYADSLPRDIGIPCESPFPMCTKVHNTFDIIDLIFGLHLGVPSLYPDLEALA